MILLIIIMFISIFINYLQVEVINIYIKNDIQWFIFILLQQAKLDGKDLDVPEIMNTWLLQMGYPVVSVNRVINKAEISQKHYLMDYTQTPSSKYPSPYQYVRTI